MFKNILGVLFCWESQMVIWESIYDHFWLFDVIPLIKTKRKENMNNNGSSNPVTLALYQWHKYQERYQAFKPWIWFIPTTVNHISIEWAIYHQTSQSADSSITQLKSCSTLSSMDLVYKIAAKIFKVCSHNNTKCWLTKMLHFSLMWPDH